MNTEEMLEVTLTKKAGCFEEGETVGDIKICAKGDRCSFVKDCIWMKTDIELRDNSQRGAERSDRNTVLETR
ncbi:MAG: hypothetical protein WAV41_02855 [Microgenomates group bacterium]